MGRHCSGARARRAHTAPTPLQIPGGTRVGPKISSGDAYGPSPRAQSNAGVGGVPCSKLPRREPF